MTWGMLVAIIVLIVAVLSFIVPGMPEWVVQAEIIGLCIAILTGTRKLTV